MPLGDSFGCFYQTGNGSSYFIDGEQMPCRTGAFYNNMTEFDWTMGLRRSVENINYAKIDFEGNHFIGGSSLVLTAENPETPQLY